MQVFSSNSYEVRGGENRKWRWIFAFDRCVNQSRLDTALNASWVNNPIRFSLRELSWRDKATEDTLKAEFRSHFRYFKMLNIERSSAPQFFGLPYLHMVIDEDNKIVAFSNRPINRDPKNGDRSLQLFLLHILTLCNVWQYWNTCASRVIRFTLLMQLP